MAKGNLFTRDDTFFGVCQGLGEDLGFNPQWLRAALGVLIFLNPVAVICGYAGAGLIVLATRLLYPTPEVATEQAAAPIALESAAQRAENDEILPPVARAA